MFRFQEQILIHQIKNGNQVAFSQIYDYYQNRIYRFIYFKISDDDRAQDLTNEVFIKFLNYLMEKSESIDNLRAFLYQMARNLVIDFYRQRNREELPIDQFIEDNISEETNLEKGVDIKLDIEKTENALNQLSEPYREVIILRFIEEMPFKEISQITGYSETNARMLVHRGLNKLRELIEI